VTVQDYSFTTNAPVASPGLETPAGAVSQAVTAPDWNGLIVLFAANNWDSVKLADRHMAEQLTAHGPVLYVDPAMSHLTRFKNPAMAASARRPRLKFVAPRIARFTPIVAPKPTSPAMTRLTTTLVRRQLRQVVRELGGSVHAVISTWLFLDVYGVCGEQRRVYWWQDDPVGAAAHWNARADRLARAEEELARASDLVAAVNEDAVARWRDRGVPAVHLPNGCDADSFAAVDETETPSGVDLAGPIAGFVGHLNSRTDMALLEAVADSGASLLIIGPKDPSFEPERFQRLAARANVAYLGPRPFEALPSYFKLIDVGLVPYGDTEFNRWSFPMKTLECLAAGRPVVATSLPAVRWLNSDLVTLADTPEDFAAAVVREAVLSRDPVLVRRRRAFAADHSWAGRAEDFAELLGIRPGSAGRTRPIDT
jgi:glycosyltransferase involved in cell wall biosynthesis